MTALHVMLVAPVFLPVAQGQKYGGTERVIYNLAKEFSRRGVQVTVAATGDSDIGGNGHLIWLHERSLWPLEDAERKILDGTAAVETHLAFCLEYAMRNGVDLIHDHADLVGSDAYERVKGHCAIPIVKTIHGGVGDPGQLRYERWRQAQQEGCPVHFIAISESQRREFEEHVGIRFFDVVHNGIPVEQFPLVREKQEYLFWIGRITWDKGTDLAIRFAKAVDLPLILAGEVHTIDKEFYETNIRHKITHFVPGATPDEKQLNRDRIIHDIVRRNKIIKGGESLYLGPLDTRQKAMLYGHARALVMLNRWKEPFGLVMPEALATGTPVLGTHHGSIPEVIGEAGVTVPMTWSGEVLDENSLIIQAKSAFDRIASIDPLTCRKRAEKYFSTDAMAHNYFISYKKIIGGNRGNGTTEDIPGGHRAA